ncbi:MAG: protein phosphatase CheZ, partial [Nitrospirae bacterium]|nr:protein phosphatase CheZ [Nitrospirota bacterium]
MNSQNGNHPDSGPIYDSFPGGLYDALGNIAKDLNQILMKQEIVESHIKTASEDLPILSDQLLDMNRFTEEETHKILEHTERVMDNHSLLGTKIREALALFKGKTLDEAGVEQRLQEIGSVIEENNRILMNILTGLSFQDLAGQRMKRMDVILQDLQARILKLVVTYGMKKKEEKVNGSKNRELLNELESSTGVKLAQGEVNNILK